METGSAKLLPLFPLPNVVLFPGVLLPLHIFEPRYRALVADALDADRRIGMVLLRPGWEVDYEGRPPVFAFGCSGVMVHSASLDDGRYNIVLRGLDRFRIVSEDDGRSYRRALIEELPDPVLDEAARHTLASHRSSLERLLDALMKTGGSELYTTRLASMADADFVHAMAQNLDLEPLEKQALLQRDDLCQRAQSLVDLLEMRRLAARMPEISNLPQ